MRKRNDFMAVIAGVDMMGPPRAGNLIAYPLLLGLLNVFVRRLYE